jgi:hypothetical protein
MKLTFIIADTWHTVMCLQQENEYVPYRKRTVTVELTEKQKEQIKKKQVGDSGMKPVYEEIIDCFIENEVE